MNCNCLYEFIFPEFETPAHRAAWVFNLPSEVLSYLTGDRTYNINEIKELAEKYPNYFKCNDKRRTNR